jgi:glutamate synthase (NADPH/NADH) large chain
MRPPSRRYLKKSIPERISPTVMSYHDPPQAADERGLYAPQFESDACGTGVLARLDGVPAPGIVRQALTMLERMAHRGASGWEPNTGDGAGITVQLPHEFFVRKLRRRGLELPARGQYAVGMLFLPPHRRRRAQIRAIIEAAAAGLGFDVLAYRRVPVDPAGIGAAALSTAPRMEQLFVQPRKQPADTAALERRLYVLRQVISHRVAAAPGGVGEAFYVASLSSRTIVYKGQLTARQVRGYFRDLLAGDFASAIAVVHSRFSTNTLPRWALAQPFRLLAHNGEINTVEGNRAWWRAREPQLRGGQFTREELDLVLPVLSEGASDSASFDQVLEFLIHAGRSLPETLLSMAPEAWQHNPALPDDLRAFYEYQALLLEPWDGPAAICFTDGTLAGAMVDRNGLRPLRWSLTADGLLVMASETGVVPLDPARIVANGQLQPGEMLLADLGRQRLWTNDEIKTAVSRRFAFRAWLDEHRLSLIPSVAAAPPPWSTDMARLFGCTREDLAVVLKPMAERGEEPVGSMGVHTPLAVLSERPQHLSHYFKQLFAQVTNPPIDPIREQSVMSLYMPIGGSTEIIDVFTQYGRFVPLDSPVLTEAEFVALRQLDSPAIQVGMLETLWASESDPGALETALDRLGAEAARLVHEQACRVLVLSDRHVGAAQAAIPSLLALGAVHQHLVRTGLRTGVALVVDAGDVWAVHHVAALIGFGANAVCPYLAYGALANLHEQRVLDGVADVRHAMGNYRKALDKGLLKILSKLGISTIQSYCGAQRFEAVGLAPAVMARCFPGAVSRLGGLDFDRLAAETLERHRSVFAETKPVAGGLAGLDHDGRFQWRRDGEYHRFNPQTIHLLQHAVRRGDYQLYEKFAAAMHDAERPPCTLRDLLDLAPGHPVPLEEVEPVEAILRRFSSGAMSFGSISHEAHVTLAIAMNRIGGKSNCGEGGEDEARNHAPDAASGVRAQYLGALDDTDWQPGDSARSAIRQVASGRFGVTSAYLAAADELQIKMAQGAKPGEGGQLPGDKVDAWIGRVRYARPGTTLISPPPHHDIYSIEDLAQLIFDLKHANPRARISVKLVAKAGVGVIAAGVAKAKADVILISGHDGGTGASSLSSIHHAGLPWELGLAEAHQTLVRNRLRDRVVLQTDGQLCTGRDLAMAALLGAEEWVVATAALVAEGCILMRKCHLNTCPVGIATQDPVLRRRFAATPEHLVRYFTYLARDLRGIMAALGFRTIEEMVGRVDRLCRRLPAPAGLRAELDLTALLYREPAEFQLAPRTGRRSSDALLDGVLDHELVARAAAALHEQAVCRGRFQIANTDRAVGTLLSWEVSRRYGASGLPDGTIRYRFRGSAGQSFGAFLAPGLDFRLYGEANDYCGKGLSGGRVVVTARSGPRRSKIRAEGKIELQTSNFEFRNTVIGNVAFYGATGGEAYIAGRAGARFAVRNSGLRAVVEGVGDHAGEYMTGGTVVLLGPTGRNVGAGMSGGVIYALDPDGALADRCNRDSVELVPLGEADRRRLHGLLQRHFYYTRSAAAKEVLRDWETAAGRFVKIRTKQKVTIAEFGLRIAA